MENHSLFNNWRLCKNLKLFKNKESQYKYYYPDYKRNNSPILISNKTSKCQRQCRNYYWYKTYCVHFTLAPITIKKFPKANEPCAIGLDGFEIKKGNDKAIIKPATILIVNPVVKYNNPFLLILLYLPLLILNKTFFLIGFALKSDFVY